MANHPDWTNDPAIRMRMLESKARGQLIRGAIIWTPPFLILLGLFLYFLWDRVTGPEHGSTWFLVILLGIFTTLLGFMAVASWRDLRSGTQEIEGLVTRAWARRDSLIWQTHYLRVDERILRVDAVTHAQLAKGQHVRAVFYPHSGIAVFVEKIPDPLVNDEYEDKPALSP